MRTKGPNRKENKKMFRRNVCSLMCALLSLTLCIPSFAQPAETSWHLSGDLSEACSCGVPCPCNFGANPTHPYCWALFSLDIKEGNYGDLSLKGLHLAGAGGAKGLVLYAD